MALIKLNGVSRVYRRGGEEVYALEDFDLEIAEGTFTSVMGPSGSGKTVLMRQLIRLEKADSGEILVNGRDFQRLEGLELAAMRRTMGMVFQMSALFDSMTIDRRLKFHLMTNKSG